MKRKLSALSRRYEGVLRIHLSKGPRTRLHAARTLGRQAVALGLETLDLARIHEGALAALGATVHRDGLVRRAELFFAEVITPIENTHRAALKTSAHLEQLNRRLGRETVDLVAARQLLKQCVAQRKAVQLALKKSGGANVNLLNNSILLDDRLRRLTHQILSAQEDARKKISREMHDEIAQTLLGINVRLLALKQKATVNIEGLEKEIASTQQLVKQSVKIVKRFAREFSLTHES